MDEARHHLAYRRFIDAMGEEVEDIDPGTEMMFDALLAMNDPLELIATEQFFLESFAMSIFEGLRRERDASAAAPDHRAHHARREPAHGLRRPLHRGVDAAASRSTRRIAFARRWMGQILGSLLDRPGPDHARARRPPAARRRAWPMRSALAPQMLREQQEINAAELAEATSGAKVPHLLKSARRAGLLEPEILEALGLSSHPLIRGALRASLEPEPSSTVAD